jgi:subtilisin family serine protease
MTHVPPRPLIIALGVLVSLLLIAQPVDSHQGLAASSPATKLGPGVRQAADSAPNIGVIVTLRQPSALRGPRIDVQSLRSQVASAQGKLLFGVPASEFVPTRRYTAVPAVAGRVTADGLRALEARSDVAQVALDGVGDAGLAQSVPLIHADETFDAGVTGAGEVVAVIDTGVDTDHVDLADSIAYEKCFLTGGGCPAAPHVAEDDHGHGTNVAGIITSNGTVAPRGVAPDAQIAAYKVLNASGSGLFSDWLAALDDIIANHPEVDFVNMSLQSSFACPSMALDTAVTTLHQQGIGTFIAAGNHGTKNELTIPACLTDAITVGAVYDSDIGSSPSLKSSCTDSSTAVDVVACWSDSSPDLDLLAPGAYVTSTGRTGGTSNYLGTSQAAPHAAAVAALVKQSLPSLSLDDIVSRMKSTGTVITDDLDDGDPATNRQTPRIDARVALLTDDNADYDGDGCTNGQEYGLGKNDGGQRNPLWRWDYMNPTGDGENRIDDVLAVVDQYFIDQGDPGYTDTTDRTYIGPYPWSLGAPNGMQRIDDVIAAVSQYFADCP